MFIVLCILSLIIGNIGSFILIQLLTQSHSRLIVIKPAKRGEKMNYLLGGTFISPSRAFQFSDNELEGGITLVKYPIMRWSAWRDAKAILEDIDTYEYQARIFAVSVTGHVTQWIEDDSYHKMTKFILVSPWSSILFTRAEFRNKIKRRAVLWMFLKYLLGWISTLYFVADVPFSIAASQLWTISFKQGWSPNSQVEQVELLVLADSDHILKNGFVKRALSGHETTEIRYSGGHQKSGYQAKILNYLKSRK